ncbi:YdcF family protein [Entomohabitans teleogrylli]|uniref:YdcF family protein n=1 Tax=Entomohabitans teleogrylli TaxID=1384589 RepID=UPI00073DB546|nr:YdcF family protein [Entomohabitans teleogrylli]
MKRRGLIYGAALVFTLALGAMLVNACAIYRYGQQDETRPADCAIVPGAGVNGNIPSPVFQGRLDHAVRLYRAGYVPRLILTGGYSPGQAVSDAQVARRYVLAQGVPAQAILIEQRSRITRENLHYARQLMQAQRLNSALIVSDPLHMKRTMLIAADSGIRAFSSPTPDTRYRSRAARARFLARESFFYSGYLGYRLLAQALPGQPAE